MEKFVKTLRGYHQRLGDLIKILDEKGYSLPYKEKDIDRVFRQSGPGKNSCVWNDEKGDIIVMVYAVELFADDIKDSMLTIIDANYFDIETLTSGIKGYLHK